MGAKLELAGVTVEYHMARSGKTFVALQNVNLAIMKGEFVSIVGPSGCGKTTFLNAIDGLTPVTRGEIRIDQRVVTGPGRDRAMVFQTPALLPWRTVISNVMYGLELQGVDSKQARQVAREYVRLVGLEGFEEHYPTELSTGMQQRVNMARALATDPDILLMDEPLASLDAQTRELMQAELLRIWMTMHKTTVFVAHDIHEAIYLSDRVVVFGTRPGRIRRIIDIDLPRPRALKMKRQPEFLKYEEMIWELIGDEISP